MTPKDRALIEAYWHLNISRGKLLADYSIDLLTNKQYVISELENAIKSNNSNQLKLAIELLFLSDITEEFVDVLNKLLIHPGHIRHQEITRFIQDLKSPSSVPYIEKLLATNFNFLKYTASETGAIAKWFSWALYSIGTEESFDVIEKYADALDEGIRNEMRHRLKVARNSL